MTCHKCSKCGEEKDEEEFPIDKRSKSGRASKCKACKRQHYRDNRDVILERNKGWYARNKGDVRKRATLTRRSNLELWKEHMPMAFECSACGYDECPAALDFHHVDRSKKEKHISYFLVRKPTEGRIAAFKEELEKCIILCANCHREHHYDTSI